MGVPTFAARPDMAEGAMSRSRLFMLLVALALPGRSASALVGPTGEGGGYAPHVVMALAQARGGSGFCSGAVLAPNIVLTAAHCVAAPGATRVHFRDSAGKPVLMEVARVARHPGFRADAVAARNVPAVIGVPASKA